MAHRSAGFCFVQFVALAYFPAHREGTFRTLRGRVCRLCFSGLDTIGVGLVGPGLFGAELITGAVVAGLFAGVVGAGLFAGVVGAGLFAGVVAGLLRGRGRRNYVDFTYRIFQHSRRRAYDEDIFSFM